MNKQTITKNKQQQQQTDNSIDNAFKDKEIKF